MNITEITTRRSARELVESIQRHPVRRAYLPMELELSSWVPLQREADGKLYLAAFFYPVVIRFGRPKEVGRPAYRIVVDPTDGRLGELVDCAYEDFAAGIPTERIVGEVRHEDLPGSTIQELEQARDALYRAYDELLGFAFKPVEQLSPAERE